MATGDEHVAAAEKTPLRNAANEQHEELIAPPGWQKKLNSIRGGRVEVVFVSPAGDVIKSKRALPKYLSEYREKHPGSVCPAASEFNWGTGNTPRRSSRLSGKVKATESPEDEKPPKRERSSSSKRGKKGKQEDAGDAPAETEDHTRAEEAKATDIEMKDADNAQEEKNEADDAQNDKKEDAQQEKKEADDAQEEKQETPDTDAADKTGEGEGKAEVLELPSDVSALVPENEGDEKPAESEVAPAQGLKIENGLATESPVSPQEKAEEVDITINPVTPPPVETKVDAPAAEAAKDEENPADTAVHKDDQVNSVPGEQVNCDNKGQIQPGASTVKCT